jgi:CBS domain-containing protein/anti-sigma regulatory factor (Ser/Thr protein kinase)
MAITKEVTKVQELIYEMKVGQVMMKDVITVDADRHMSDLRALLHDERIAGVPVVDDDSLVGMISLEDFITFLSDGGHDCSVKERMSRDVKTLFDTDPLVHAVEEFEHWDYGRFPVLNRQTGKLVGIITKGDIIKGLLNKMEIDYHKAEARQRTRRHSIRDVMADQAVITFHYDIIGNDFTRAGEASSKLKKALGRLGIPAPTLRRVAIASYEAEMNTTIYTKGGKMTASVAPEAITVQLEDNGPGIKDVKKALEPGFSTAPDWIREMGFGAGMGLPNIKACTDDMELRSKVGKGTQLRFTVVFERNGTSEAANHH